MKKIILSIAIILFLAFSANTANAFCLQCPEIQKELKKEIKLTKEQQTQIKTLKQNMKKQIAINEKALSKNQKQIDKILDADSPDIIHMMSIKQDNSKIKLDIMQIKKETYSQIFEVYTDEQKETAKRILSENAGITPKKDCDFCDKQNKITRKKH